MRSSDLNLVEKLIGQGESLSFLLRTNPAGLNLDELDGPPELLDAYIPPIRAIARVCFMRRVRNMLVDMDSRAAAAALQGIAGISFTPRDDQFVTAESGSGKVLNARTVEEYQQKLGMVTIELKKVKSALPGDRLEKKKAKSTGRPRDDKSDDAYDLLRQKMKDDELRQKYPERWRRKRAILRDFVRPLFAGSDEKEWRRISQNISARENKRTVERRKRRNTANE